MMNQRLLPLLGLTLLLADAIERGSRSAARRLQVVS